VQSILVDLLHDTPLAPWTESWAVATPPPGTPVIATVHAHTLSPGAELAIIVLGLLAPCLVAFTIAIPGRRRVVLVVGAVVLGTATLTLSTALNFGPSHAFAWTTQSALVALAIGGGAAMVLSLVPRRVAAGFGLVALTALVMLVAQAPADPYFSQSLQGWEQGRFIRFHGAAQWVGWVWPYAALIYLLVRLAVRDPVG
jgi:hypothetical protein